MKEEAEEMRWRRRDKKSERWKKGGMGDRRDFSKNVEVRNVKYINGIRKKRK